MSTTYRPTEVGNLYVGDTVSLPGDILATVTGFDFTDLHDRPGYVGLQFDGFQESRLYATTDVLDVEVRGPVCVVDRNRDGLTLWDCTCRECVSIQRDWYRTNGDES